MTEITKDTVIGDILDICPDAAPYFLQMGMHCLGCPASGVRRWNRLALCMALIQTICWSRSML